MYSVSSSFAAAVAQKNATLARQFMIGTSDYSSFVLKYPSISKQWDSLKAQTVTIDLSNDARTFNFIASNPTTMRAVCTVKIGVASEFITTFAGTIDAVKYSDASCSLTLIDKFKRLSERKIGDTTSPVSYTGSSHLIHDMAWYSCTSLGGLSAVASTSNPDIDYGSFTSWTSVFSTDNVRASAHLTGQQPIEMLRKLAALTQSAIFVENDKLKFVRFSLTDSAQLTLNDAGILSSTATLDDRNLINRQHVSANYNVTSKSFSITCFADDTASVNSYGLRENLVSDNFVWLTDSVSALNLAQRTIQTNSDVVAQYSIKTPLQGILSTIGDTVIYNDSLLQVNAPYRIMSETLNLDDGTKSCDIDLTQIFGAFLLDSSLLDGTDVLL